MSGGHFNYAQDRIELDIAPRLKQLIAKNKTPNEFELEYNCYNGQRYSDETLEEFKKGLEALRVAYVYIQRIDWLVSGDDGEDTFHERLAHDLTNYHWMTILGEDAEDE